MEYLYETHCHSSGCSACARSTPEEMVRAYHAKGFQGLILTNHFVKGNNCLPRELPWEQKMRRYWEEYLRARDEGEKLDFDVFFGIEYYYGGGQEILTCGIDLGLLLAHPEFENCPVWEYTARIHEAGGYLSWAHPFRAAPWIDRREHVRPELVDALEVYNYCNREGQNEPALELARARNLGMTAGTDAHWDTFEGIGQAGMIFSERIKTGAQLVEALRARRGKLLMDGRAVDPRTV